MSKEQFSFCQFYYTKWNNVNNLFSDQSNIAKNYKNNFFHRVENTIEL